MSRTVPAFVIGRNVRDANGNSTGVPEVMCVDEFKRPYWRSLEVAHFLDYPDAVGFDAHESAWKAADLYGGHPVHTATYGARLRSPVRDISKGEARPHVRPLLSVVPA